jgi:hypothetical protein
VELSGIALQGLQTAETRFAKAAGRVGSPASLVPGTPADSADLSQNAVELLDSANQYSLNLAVMKTADDIQRRTIDLLA